MITNTKLYGNHFDADINDIVFDEYAAAPKEYIDVAKISDAPPGNHYTASELSPIGHLREIPEGHGVEFDYPVEGHKKTVYYTEYGLGIVMTKHMVKDDLFGNFKNLPAKLGKSAAVKPDVLFWDLFNSGFDTHTAWDGQYVFDTDHTTLKSGDTIKNEPATAASLSETSLQAGFEYFDGAGDYGVKDEAGLPINMTPYKLIVPSELRGTASKLRNTPLIVGSADNDINTVNPAQGVYPGWELMVSRWLTSSTAWFLISKEHDFRLYWKEQPELESSDDFATGNALFKITMRFATFVMDYKGAYGNPGA